MTDSIDDFEMVLLHPPTQKDYYNTKKPWLIGRWLLPATDPEIISNHFNLVAYHWDNRIKFESDISMIKSHITNLKKYLYPILNNLHRLNHSTRYWDVLIGEWIYLYTQVLFDRWNVVESVFETIKNPCLVNDAHKKNYIPFDTKCFQNSATSDHNWNANLLLDISYDYSKQYKMNKNTHGKVCYSFIPSRIKTNLARRLLLIFSKIYTFIIPERLGIIVQAPYLSKINSIILCFKLKGLMYLESRERYIPHFSESVISVRENLATLMEVGEFNDPFFRFLMKSVVDYLPAIYLEDYAEHKKYAEEKYFNFFPRIVVTANSHYSDEVWKSWAASATQSGTKIILLQHGGHYGHSRFSLMQDYEIDICDKFLTWGWIIPTSNKVKVAPSNKLIGLNIERKSKDTCLVVTYENSCYSSWLASTPVGPQVVNSKEMTIDFLNTIKDPVRPLVRVRIYPIDYGLDQKNTFESKFPQLSFSPSDCDFRSDLRDVRVVIFNYFSTSFIEAVKAGIPSVVFINPDYYEVKDSYTSLFLSLVDIGVLHHSSKSCAQFVEQIWDSVDAWWSNPVTIQVIDEFLRVFGYTSSTPITELSQVILEI